MSFNFIRGELSEAKFFRNPSKLGRMITSQMADNLFNTILALQILKYINPTAALKYAQLTLINGTLDGWRITGSDLHNIIFILKNPDRYADNLLKDRYVSVPSLMLTQWLRNIISGKDDKEYDRRFLLRLQKDLGIHHIGLKAARRLVADWDRALDNEKKLAASKIYQTMQHDLKPMDLFQIYSRSITKKKLLLDDIPELSGVPLTAKSAVVATSGYLSGNLNTKI